jgi:hypothetical protein
LLLSVRCVWSVTLETVYETPSILTVMPFQTVPPSGKLAPPVFTTAVLPFVVVTVELSPSGVTGADAPVGTVTVMLVPPV